MGTQRGWDNSSLELEANSVPDWSQNETGVWNTHMYSWAIEAKENK